MDICTNRKPTGDGVAEELTLFEGGGVVGRVRGCELIQQSTRGLIESRPETAVRYYTNPNNQHCFPCAVANLLIELGDYQTADQVYSNFWQHRLARNYCSLLLLPRYVADLTGERYGATLHMAISPERTFRILRNFPADKRVAAEDEIISGRVRFAAGLRLVPRTVVIVPRERSCHAMLYRGRHCYIDDGRPSVYPYAVSYIVGLLQLESHEHASDPRESDQLQLVM